MPRKPILAQEELIDLHFPKAGVDVSAPFGQQPNRPVAGGEYARTTALGVNVRGYDPAANRARGGARPGLVKYVNFQPGGVTWITQLLDILVSDRGTSMQLSQSGRIINIVAISQGNVYTTTPGGTFWTPAANNTGETPPLNISGVIFSAANIQKLWFADGINYAYFDPAPNAVLPWIASAGVLPVDSANNTPRLIQTWRGRTVLSGLILDPQNWFMSAVGDPTNFDYSPLSISPTMAVAGNNSPLGLIGSAITTIIPYTDDVLVFGADHQIWLMQGDPADGGQLALVSDIIGMAWGIPWCKDPYGNIFFVSNKMGIYTMVPGQQPQRISQAIEQLLKDIDTGANSIRAVWDDRAQGCHFYITLLANPASTIHFFYEQRSGAWWTDTFGNTDLNPIATVTLDGNTAADRVVLLGSWDGYVRALSPDAPDDDGTPIASTVTIGPLLTQTQTTLLLKDLQAILGATSGSVTFSVQTGATAEIALTSVPVVQGVWGPGRNLNTHIRWAGHALYVTLSATVPWAFEQIRCRFAGTGKVRQRGR